MQFDPKGPFPLPFTGKGGGDTDWRSRSLQQRLENSQSKRGEIEQAMRTLVEQFKQTFRPPWPAHLTLHNTGNSQYVRWRLQDNQVSSKHYFELLHSPSGISLLQSLSSAVRQVYLEFEQERLKLNLLYGLYHYEVRSLQRYLDSVRCLSALKRGL